MVNWEDEKVASKNGVSEDEDDGVNRPLTVYSYDNLGEVTETQVYNGDGITPTISSGELSLPEDSYTDEPAADSLQAQTITSYDSQGQVWQTQVYSVNPTTGAVSSAALTTENYYDPNGNLIAASAPGGLWTKTTYNGAGWPVMQYLTDGGSGTSYADASIVSSDVVLTQTQQLYDNDGNVVESITSDRFSTDSTSATGALGTRDSGIEARIYYSGNYYDDANRLIATANVGTNGGSTWDMPSTPPSRTDDALVTTYGYAADAVQTVTFTGGPTGGTFTLTFDGDTTGTISYNASAATVQSDLAALTSVGSGNVTVTTGINGGWQVRFTESLGGTYENQITASGSGLTGGTSPGVSVSTLSLGGDNGTVVDTTDPDNIDTRDYYDPLGNVVQEVQDFTTGAITANTNKTTDYAYNSAGMTSLTAAMLNSDSTITGETTEWIYGVTTGTGSDIDSTDIVSATYQPNPSTGAPDSSLATTVTVDALGETITSTDPNGTTHTYTFDVLGQQTADTVTTLGTGVDGSVMKITTAYTTLGNPSLVTSYNSSSNVVNQVEMLYNGLDQEIQEFEAVNGAVNLDSTPSVQDNYTNLADGNNSRLTSIEYPDGYTVDYNYSSGLDSDISRLSYLSDDTGTLQSYQYLGLNTVVVMTEPQANLELTYLTTDDATSTSDDQYTGLDQFGRVDEQLWYNTTTSTAVYDVQYIRDDDGNVLFAIDTLNSSMGGLYEYDNLGQVIEYEQGDVVYLGPDYGISGSVVESETFTYDSMGNDLVNSTTTTGTTTITSIFNYDNQIASISSGTLPTYDNNGNMLTDQNDLVYVVNAWNEVVTVKNSGGTTLETYSYDGLGDRITNTVYTDNVGTTTNYFNSTEGQVLEEQANATGYYTQRYVWSPTYINSMVDRDTDTSDTGLTPTGSEFSRIWPIQDANYNTVALVVMSDDTATVVERYAYLPFGSVTYMNGSYTIIAASSYNWLYLFQGMRQDSTTSDNLSLSREENPGTGTWTSNDPLGSSTGDNDLYGFDWNSPIVNVDPNGLDPTPGIPNDIPDGAGFFELWGFGFWTGLPQGETWNITGEHGIGGDGQKSDPNNIGENNPGGNGEPGDDAAYFSPQHDILIVAHGGQPGQGGQGNGGAGGGGGAGARIQISDNGTIVATAGGGGGGGSGNGSGGQGGNGGSIEIYIWWEEIYTDAAGEHLVGGWLLVGTIQGGAGSPGQTSGGQFGQSGGAGGGGANLVIGPLWTQFSQTAGASANGTSPVGNGGAGGVPTTTELIGGDGGTNTPIKTLPPPSWETRKGGTDVDPGVPFNGPAQLPGKPLPGNPNKPIIK